MSALTTYSNQLFSYTNSSGGTNSAFGSYAAALNTTGSSNTAIGAQSLYSNTTASNNTAVGYQAGYNNTAEEITALGVA